MYRVLLVSLALAGCQTSPTTPAPRGDAATYADPKPLIAPGDLADQSAAPKVGGYVEGSAGVYRVR